ncbi:MAG: acyl-CoA synthetase [Myxococcales bacterium]|nr:acyl-CoA synthetase [Myxococcales bacterium]
MPRDTPPIIARAHDHPDNLALIDDAGQLTYGELLDQSAAAAGVLLAGAKDLQGRRVAFLTPPGIDHVVVQWGIWRAGGVAVPLCTMHPEPELAHVISDSQAEILVAHPSFQDVITRLSQTHRARLLSTEELATSGGAPSELPGVGCDRNAMLVYTSGTTGKPKGAVSTHGILDAQIRSVVEAWGWSCSDRILHALPLHHLHGILNLLCSALYSGATCEFLPRFDAQRVWQRIASQEPLTLMMAVPTMYAKLIDAYDRSPETERAAMTAGCKRLRLMVSGSAALPVRTLERWREISGHTLLERYGMTELGMALGNPLDGPRRPGHVGQPFPGVEVRIVDDNGAVVEAGTRGRLQVRGPNVFAGYFGKPEATRASFTEDGFFETGDVAQLDGDSYRILGRESVDIIKTGGYKVSALEIEAALREHPAVSDVAVVGVADAQWGQRVAAAIIVNDGFELALEPLRAWAKERLAHYKVPTLLECVEDFPRNALGKVQKPAVLELFGERAPEP